MKDLIKNLLNEIVEINSKRNYWLLRTQGGQFYDDFINREFVAIGYNQISVKDIHDSLINQKAPLDLLKNRIKKEYKTESRLSHSASQLVRFYKELNAGDIVISPSYNSARLSIGEITDSNIYIDESINKNLPPKKSCTFSKRKKIKWVKEIRRSALDDSLFKIFFSHHTLTNITPYGDNIDAILHDFYIKAGFANYIFPVKQEGKVNAKHLFSAGHNLLKLAEEFCKENGIDEDGEDVEIKIKVESPGEAKFKSKHMYYIAILALITHTLVGGKQEISFGENFKMSNESAPIIKQFSDFLDRKQERDLLESYCNEMNAKDSFDLRKILIEKRLK